jgi:transposase InsO family protein
MQQCSERLSDAFEGLLLGKRFPIHDHDAQFTDVFDRLGQDNGVELIILPRQRPDLNSNCERFVRSIEEEGLQQMLILGKWLLFYVLYQYMAHYHHERNHRGLGNQQILPGPGLASYHGQMVYRERLAGSLTYYSREAV